MPGAAAGQRAAEQFAYHRQAVTLMQSERAQCAEGFDADITVSRDGHTVPGTSIMGLMMLAAGKGTSISVEAQGPEAEAALNALADLVASGFGED